MSSTAVDKQPEPDGTAASGQESIAVSFERVSKRFADVVALHDVSLPIRRGEFMTLLGPSGCGKTTLLNLVAGFFSPDDGQILIDGNLVNDVPTYKREIGMMFQSYALFPHMTVASNVAYGLKLRPLRKDEVARRVRDVLRIVAAVSLRRIDPTIHAPAHARHHRVRVAETETREQRLLLVAHVVAVGVALLALLLVPAIFYF